MPKQGSKKDKWTQKKYQAKKMLGPTKEERLAWIKRKLDKREQRRLEREEIERQSKQDNAS